MGAVCLNLFVGRQGPTEIEWTRCHSVEDLNASVFGSDERVFLTEKDVHSEADIIADFLKETGLGEWEADSCRKQPQVSHFEFDTTPTIIDAREGSELAEIWDKFPQQVAVRLMSPLWAGFVRVDPMQQSPFDDTGRQFREVSDPVWDWLIRQVDADVDVSFVHTTAVEARACRFAPMQLVPGRPGHDQYWLLEHLLDGELIVAPESPADEVALRAGLLQMHDFLHESHQHSQSIEGEGRNLNGDYWHAIMHRREPDYGNSKYWFRRVGQHPVFPQLAEWAQSMLTEHMDLADTTEWQQRLGTSSQWNPMAFVDICEECADFPLNDPLVLIAGMIQSIEMQLLLKHTCRDALGKS